MRALLVCICCIATLAITPVLLAAPDKASNRTYLKMMDVQELWNENSYSEALQVLQEFEQKINREPYDHAVVLQYIAHTYVFMDQIEGARVALQKALQLPNIGVPLTAELKLVYGQIVLGDDRFDEAREALEYWYANTEVEKPPNQIFTLAYANYMTANLERAEDLLAIAIGKAGNPKKSWHRLYYQVLFDRKKYSAAEQLLLGIIERDPYEHDNWRLLANHHMQLEDAQAALAAITIAYNEGLLDEADDLKRMIALYSVVEVPEKAARLLEKHLADESVETDADMLKRLADLWMLSRERPQAKAVLRRAAAAAPDGRTYEMLGNIFFEDEDWENAHESYLKAIDLGGLDEPERIYLLAGISAEHGGMKEAARDAFKEARKSDDLKKQADALLRRLDRS
ncbi:MAG: hypothetical protein K0U72_16625 [Gammaproteobacteria bacterium]|nr:hypothetical protein [Gammaproteobacteria bacterium]